MSIRRTEAEQTAIFRFLARVKVEGECWVYQAARCSTTGHCSVWTGTRAETAQRCAWRLFEGSIPPGIYVLHKEVCGDPACIRPEHLYLGTHAQNMRDLWTWGRERTWKSRQEEDKKLRPRAARVGV